MNIFISWSGETSKQVAVKLRNYLRRAFGVRTWMSKDDIKIGSRWRDEVSDELANINFGIICLTPDNLQSDWILFEAGALSKMLSKDSFLVPFLFDVKPNEIPDPMSQFQAIADPLKEEDVRSLFDTIYEAILSTEKTELTHDDVDEIFEIWGKRLIEELKEIASKTHTNMTSETTLINFNKTENQASENLRDIYQISEALSDNPEPVYLYLARRFGVGNGFANFECYIEDDGTTDVKRTVEIEAFSEIAVLDSFLLSSQSTQDETAALELVYVRESGSSRVDTSKESLDRNSSLTGDQHGSLSESRIKLRRSTTVADRNLVEIVFNPPLRNGERYRYEIGESSQNAFVLGQDIINLSLTEVPYEEFGWAVFRPTRQLRLAVTFPRFEAPNVYHKAVRRSSSTGFPATPIQHSELERVMEPRLMGNSDLTDRLTLAMEIDYPMMGLVYILRWKPNYFGSTRPEENIAKKQ